MKTRILLSVVAALTLAVSSVFAQDATQAQTATVAPTPCGQIEVPTCDTTCTTYTTCVRPCFPLKACFAKAHFAVKRVKGCFAARISCCKPCCAVECGTCDVEPCGKTVIDTDCTPCGEIETCTPCAPICKKPCFTKKFRCLKVRFCRPCCVAPCAPVEPCGPICK